MAPTINAMEALSILAGQEGNGLLTERGEFVMDQAMSTVVKTLASEMGGLGARSKVVRRLIAKGARLELAEREAKAQPAAAASEVDPAEAAKEAERAKRRARDKARKEKLAQEAAQA